MVYALMCLAIIIEIGATTSLKLTDGFTRLVPTVLVLLGYAASFYLVSIVVRTLPVGVVYAIWSGLGIVGTSILAYFIYNQKLSLMTILGIAFILLGVVLVQLSSQSH